MRARHFLIGLLSGIVLTVVAATLVAVSLMREPVASPMQPEPTKDGDIVVSVGERYLSTVATEMSRKRDESIQSIVVDVWPDGRLDLAVAARVRVLGLETTLQIKVISVLQVVDQTLLFSAQASTSPWMRCQNPCARPLPRWKSRPTGKSKTCSAKTAWCRWA